jgi:hypothetical protein
MSRNAGVAQHIVDDEQRQSPHVNAGSIAPQSPCALWVPAARGHMLRWRSERGASYYSDRLLDVRLEDLRHETAFSEQIVSLQSDLLTRGEE